jgi:hypothetical protein
MSERARHRDRRSDTVSHAMRMRVREMCIRSQAARGRARGPEREREKRETLCLSMIIGPRKASRTEAYSCS